jgi:hypothetical protein
VSTYRGEPTEGRTRRELSPQDRSAWQQYKTEHARAKAFDDALRTLAWVVIVLALAVGLAVGCTRSAHASGWGTLPADAHRLCFVDDGGADCLFRVSDFDTLRFCPGTGDALHQPSPPGVLLVGFTDALTGEFTLTRVQAYEWRQYQASADWIVVGIPHQGSFADGFESPDFGPLACAEYRT